MEKLDLTPVLDALSPKSKEWREQREHDKQDGSVAFGGQLQSRISLWSYYQATRALFTEAQRSRDRLRELARPILYLQRHTVELALKRLLWNFQCIEALDCDLKANRVVEAAKYPATHDLKDLRDKLTQAFTLSGGILVIPPELNELTNAFIVFDDGDPSRLRYDTGAKPRPKEIAERSGCAPYGQAGDGCA